MNGLAKAFSMALLWIMAAACKMKMFYLKQRISEQLCYFHYILTKSLLLLSILYSMFKKNGICIPCIEVIFSHTTETELACTVHDLEGIIN